MHPMIPIHIKRKVGPEIIRYAVLVSIGVIDPFRSAEVESSDGKGNGPSRTIDGVDRKAIAVGEAIVADKICVIGPVEICGIVITVIDGLACQWIVLFEECPAPGIADPAVELAGGLFYL